MINPRSRTSSSSMSTSWSWIIAISLSCLPLVKADCFETFNGVECNGLSSGARAGIGIAIAAGFLLLAFLFAFLRRRRIAQQNQAFVTTAQQNPQAYYQAGAGAAPGSFRGGSYQPGYYNGGTQYPPPSHSSYPVYDVQSGFAPPQDPPPPQYPGYAPPSGPPPPLGARPGFGMNKDMP